MPKERRRFSRHKAWIACSLSVADPAKGAESRTRKILGHTFDLSTDAIAIVLPANETYGVDPSSLGSAVEVVLALPTGYVSLSCSLVRHVPLPSQENLVVLTIIEDNDAYSEHLKTLRE